MTEKLPRPTVSVSTGIQGSAGNETHTVDIAIARDGKEKHYTGAGSTTASGVREAVEKMIGDGSTAEWLP